MHCPFCQHDDTRVIDTRVVEEGMAIRRRRECGNCGERFNTYESADLKMPTLVKSNGRRETFEERKLRTSFEPALDGRRPDLGVADRRGVAVPGAPGRVLVEQARGAEMLVLGHRGRG